MSSRSAHVDHAHDVLEPGLVEHLRGVWWHMQVRHAAEDQVSAARQEAQRAIRDLQAAASRLQVHFFMFFAGSHVSMLQRAAY